MGSRSIFTITYEPVGRGRDIAELHFREVDQVAARRWAFAQSHGAVAYRASDDRIFSLYFNEGAVPSGWRQTGKIGHLDTLRIEAVPYKTNPRGKEIVEQMAGAEFRAPSDGKLAQLLGWDVTETPMDGYRLYFPVAARVEYPETRVFLRLPRWAGDGWEGSKYLVEVHESALMAALAAHNAEAERREGSDEQGG